MNRSKTQRSKSAGTTRRRLPTVKVTKEVVAVPLKDTTKATVSTMISRAISRNTETKHVSRLIENDIPHNSGILIGDVVPVLPDLLNSPAGTDATRIGDVVKPISLRVSGVISQDRRQALDNRVLLVRVMVLASKTIKTNSLLSSMPVSSLLKPNYGGPSAQGFIGNLEDLSAPINTDLFRVYYDKVHRIACSSDDAAKEENPASYKRWGCSVALPANLHYDGAISPSDATNFAPFLCMGYAYADGTGPDIINTRLISTSSSILKYKDA